MRKIMKMKIFDFVKRYSHGFVFSYTFIYLAWFAHLEKTVTRGYSIIHSRFDDFIPFNEYFIVPYLLWFLYVSIPLFFFFAVDREEFFRFFLMLAMGMSLSLLICQLFPNGTDLRPHIDADKNWACGLLAMIHRVDTSTNVFPSIHVFNSIATHIAIVKSRHFIKWKALHISSFILMTAICMSTVFLKQHSIIDVVGGMVLAYALYILVYAKVNLGNTREDALLLEKGF